MEKERVLLREIRKTPSVSLTDNKCIKEYVNDLETQYFKSSYMAITDKNEVETIPISREQLPKEQGVHVYYLLNPAFRKSCRTWRLCFKRFIQ